MDVSAASVSSAQGWRQIGELALAFGLSSLIGLEREWRQKAAGLSTHTLVGLGAALFLIVSKYGFSDVLGPDVRLDPSRVAAQIVTGIGFLGGGLIFVRGRSVRGLTTAATVWLTAAVGMACGAGLAILAVVVTAGHFVVMFGYRWAEHHMPQSRHLTHRLRIVYEDGRGILRDILAQSTRLGYSILAVDVHDGAQEVSGVPAAAVTLEVTGQPSPHALTVALGELSGVLEVATSRRGEGADW